MHENLTEATRKLQLGAMGELGAFLQLYAWDAFITDTFKHRVMFPRQAMNRVWARLSSSVAPIRRAFIAGEEHRLGGWHTHGLVEFEHSGCNDALVVLPSGEEWDLGREVGETPALIMEHRRRLGALGWCRVQEVRAIGGCAGYCSKYLTKEVGDYDFYGNWRETERVRL